MAPHYTGIRDALFAPTDRRGNGAPDGRGNIPNLTYETAEHEGRRRNAGRYETVAQMDRALGALPHHGMPALGVDPGPPAAEGGGFWGAALLLALGAGVAYVLMHKEEPEPDALRELVDAQPRAPRAPRQLRLNPAPAAQPAPPVTIVMPPQAVQVPTQATVTVPVVIPPPAVAPSRRRRGGEGPPRVRRSRAAPKIVPVVVPVVAVPPA